MEYNGTKYWYDKNLQGDVVDIRNSTGTLIARYVYDAWGNHRQITDSSGNDVSADTSHIANINPFRYRGYYYDVETGWYYLNARYYDPNVGRFLSPDVILGANGGLQGYNLFAYCNNNPVMFADPSGRSIILTGLAAKAATALGVLVTPIITKGIADGLKATADLLDSGIQAIADLFSSSDDKPETVTVTPSAPERTMEDILQDIVDYQKWRPFANILPMPDITFEVNGDIVIFDLSSGTPTIMTKKAGAGISEHTNGSKNWNKHSKKRPGAKEKGDVNRFPRINKKKRNIIK